MHSFYLCFCVLNQISCFFFQLLELELTSWCVDQHTIILPCSFLMHLALLSLTPTSVSLSDLSSNQFRQPHTQTLLALLMWFYYPVAIPFTFILTLEYFSSFFPLLLIFLRTVALSSLIHFTTNHIICAKKLKCALNGKHSTSTFRTQWMRRTERQQYGLDDKFNVMNNFYFLHYCPHLFT